MTNPFGFSKGQRFQLTKQDFTNKLPPHKSRGAVVGLAIDTSIKRYLGDKISVPSSRYEVFDFEYNGEYYDIKSFAKSSITVSNREWQFALNKAAEGTEVYYLIFKQLNDSEFEYEGMTSCSRLRKKNKIRESQYDCGGVYFSPLVTLT
jgi:hypothetical protein